jgi:hypothetical protein
MLHQSFDHRSDKIESLQESMRSRITVGMSASQKHKIIVHIIQ